MTQKTRLRRSEPDRIGPIRNLVGAPPRSADASGALGSALESSLRAGQTAAKITNATARGAVEAGVQTAYMVYEEYIIRGREAALRHQARSADMSGTNWRGTPIDAWTQAWGPMAPMIAPWTQMMQLWTESMYAWMPGGAGEMASAWMSPTSWMGGTGPGSPAVIACVSSMAPTEVKGELRPGAAALELFVDDLSGISTANSLSGVTLDCQPESNQVIVNVNVQEGQRAGTYRGKVRDQWGNEQGYVAVRVHETDPAGRQS